MARRMRAWVSLLWLVPAVAAGGLWVRSCRTIDEFSGVDGDNVLARSCRIAARCTGSARQRNGTPRGWAWDASDLRPGATWAELYTPGDEDWRRAGFAKFSAEARAARAAAADGADGAAAGASGRAGDAVAASDGAAADCDAAGAGTAAAGGGAVAVHGAVRGVRRAVLAGGGADIVARGTGGGATRPAVAPVAARDVPGVRV